jgi:glucokinase
MTNLYASVDLGGTKIACALGTADGSVVAERTTPTRSHEGPEAVVRRIAELTNSLAREVGQTPAALGMGVPGNADMQSGTVLFLPNLPGNWRNIPVREWLEPQVECPVSLLNDVRLATLGELAFGHGMQTHTFAFFAIGTGIGGGFALDGRLYVTGNGANCEFGHHTIVPDGPRCGCGSRGCLETLSSGPAITAEGVRLLHTGQTTVLHELTDGDAGRVNPAVMALAAEKGDRAVIEVLDRCSEYLGIAVANVVSFFHPPLVVLGGGVGESGAIRLDAVQRTMKWRVGMFPTEDVRIEPSHLGVKAGVLGGFALAAGIGMA